MPLYEYECPKDGRFELIRKFSARPLKKCPTCGGPVVKMASAPAIQFKGSGWYVTDYARKSNGDGEKKSSKAVDTKAEAGTKDSAKDSSAKSEATEKAAEKKSEKKSATGGSTPS